MILHLLEDDKFADYVIDHFTAVSAETNKFLVIVYSKNCHLSNIHQKDKVEVMVAGSPALSALCKELGRYNAIIAHNLFTNDKEVVLQSAPQNVKVGWVFWGGELYARREYITKYLGRETRLLHLRYNLKQKLKGIYYFVIKGKKYPLNHEPSKRVFQRVDFCLTDIEEDYLLAKKIFHADFRHLWFNYYSIEDTIGPLINSSINDNNILVGNSASLTNNHLEAFRKLSKFNLQDRKIYTPLSYGDKQYTNRIMQSGQKMFGDQFLPLIEFMEREQYNRLMLSCSIVIMNHIRHQAMGNIITALWLGARVYLSKYSTTYAYFKRLGVYISSVEDDLIPVNPDALLLLDKNEVEYNRQILIQEYGRAKMLRNVKEIIDILNN
jgi:hypothetical protein